MLHDYSFLAHVLDAITEHIVVIDAEGYIQFVNKSWTTFGDNNACTINADWHQMNYLDECDKASQMGDTFGTAAAKGIRSVIHEEQAVFYFEYPCHSPTEKRWFMMRVTSFPVESERYYVISHQNITERKLAEEAVWQLSRIDGLTQIANRRCFDEFLEAEWRRCIRLKQPICLAMIDIDDFKLLNDHYGHQVGDQGLIKLAELLTNYTHRPSDICARFGGEEFVLVWGGLSVIEAQHFAEKLLMDVNDMAIPNHASSIANTMTVSIGMAAMWPEQENLASRLIEQADKALYQAKRAGKNRLCLGETLV